MNPITQAILYLLEVQLEMLDGMPQTRGRYPNDDETKDEIKKVKDLIEKLEKNKV